MILLTSRKTTTTGRVPPVLRPVQPQSFEISKRLAKLPYLEALVIQGKAKFVHTPAATGSCKNKAETAGIALDRVLRASYHNIYSKEDEGNGARPRVFCIITVGSQKIDKKRALTEFTDEMCGQGNRVTGNQAKRAQYTADLPDMKAGTCTPFLTAEGAERVHGIVFTGGAEPETVVDVSIGGKDDAAPQYSVQLPYGEVVRVVKEQFGDKLLIVDKTR